MTPAELKAARKESGLSQADFAVRLGLSRDYVGLMERGRAPIKPRTIDAVRHMLFGLAFDKEAQRQTPITSDPVERLIELALIEAGIRYETDHGGRNASGLDFRLPDYGVEIEVKRMHSPRISEQMSRVDNAIAVQGLASARLFADMIRALGRTRDGT